MGNLMTFTLEQSKQWDAIVRSFQNHDVYWLSGYVKAFQLHGDGDPLLFYYEDGNTRGINVVMKRDIAKDQHFDGVLPEGKYYDFSTPYGYGGWLIEGEDSLSLFDAYEKWCRKNSVVCEFVRFHPVIKNHTACEKYYTTIALGETVKIDLSSPEIIQSKMKSEARTRVRKAIKNGIKIYNGRFPGAFDAFKEVYDKTMDKDCANPYYYFSPAFYSSICNDLPQNVEVFYAIKDDKVISSAIMLLSNGMMNYHLGGSLPEYSSFGAANLVIYSAAIWGSINGFKSLYLGGGVGSGEDSLLRFKKTFNVGDEYDRYYIGKKIFLSGKYEELLGIRRDCADNGFFPAYRS